MKSFKYGSVSGNFSLPDLFAIEPVKSETCRKHAPKKEAIKDAVAGRACAVVKETMLSIMPV